MTKEELQDTLAFLNEEAIPNVEIYILDEPVEDEAGDLEINIYKGRMHEDMPKQITDLFFPKMRRILLQRDYELETYNPAVTQDRKVVWQHASADVPFYNLILERLPLANQNYYDDDTLAYEDIWAIWIKFRIGGNNFYLLKKITPSKVLTTGGVLAWVFRGDTFRRLDKDVLTIDGHFDVFACNDTLIFENKANFEKALMYDEIIQQVADETLNEIQRIEIVENFEELRTMLADDYHSIRKLNKLRQKQYFREKTFADYHRIIQDYNVPVNVDLAKQKFAIADKAQAKLLIKVLNDDYLKSELTNIKYSANSKEDI
ncbi:hypothetical protein DSECCO2_453040 [anaerobic digester metagenome]